MKTGKRITAALIGAGPDPCPMLFTGRGARDGPWAGNADDTNPD